MPQSRLWSRMFRTRRADGVDTPKQSDTMETIDAVLARAPVPDPSDTLDRSDRPLSRQRFVIYFTPRSGSSWLKSVLVATDRLGVPDEYFNPEFVPRQATILNARTLDEYIDGLTRLYVTPNSVFVVQTTPFHLAFVGDLDRFFAHFPPASPCVFLVRQNVVRQAISLYKAVETNVFHTVAADADAIARSHRFERYDGEAIARWMMHILEQERLALRLFAARDVDPLVVSYEEMFAGPLETVEAIAGHFGLRPDPAQRETIRRAVEENPHRALASAANDRMERRFRLQFHRKVAAVERERSWLREALDAPPRGPVGQPVLKGDIDEALAHSSA